MLGKTWSGYTCPFEGLDIPDSEEALLAAREEAISYAVYRIMTHRFGDTPDGEITMFNINTQMAMLGYDIGVTTTDYQNDGPATLGNYVAEQVIAFGMQDGANEAGGMPRIATNPSTRTSTRNAGQPRRHRPQPLATDELTLFIDQSGNVSTDIPEFVGPEGGVVPFALDSADLELLGRDNCTFHVWKNPGAPVHFDSTSVASSMDDPWKWNFAMVSAWSSTSILRMV